MNSSSFKALRSPAVIGALLFSFGLTPLAKGGILDILRGGSGQEPAPINWQRVAFVGQAEVKQITGAAERLVGVERWAPLPEGTALHPGDVIRCYANSSIILRMNESGSLVKMTPGTLLRLTPLETGWQKSVLTGEEERAGYSVRGVRGNAYFSGPGSTWERVVVNSVLPPRSIVRTDRGSSLDLLDRSTGRFVRIEGGSQAELNEELVATRSYKVPEIAAAAPILGR